MLDQAEARGAAEQRRKDAEGQEPFAYVDPADIEQPFVRLGSADIEIRKTAAWSYTQPIYTRPANVAALEADATRYRIVRQRFLEDARDRGESLTPTQFDEKVDGDTQARAALTREGGV
ncbi:hypothetical protein [Gluconobacter japonicus]|uniref:hypothetical protein n=1 Tax=Gluconobacter japonicus TaxID=376620 RepID=UPI001B8C2EAF|nr:hypothetical protein [Gluconobacter japonicus]MBS1050525.1 hypothetical protein [Gluconobacter japonicus]